MRDRIVEFIKNHGGHVDLSRLSRHFYRFFRNNDCYHHELRLMEKALLIKMTEDTTHYPKIIVSLYDTTIQEPTEQVEKQN